MQEMWSAVEIFHEYRSWHGSQMRGDHCYIWKSCSRPEQANFSHGLFGQEPCPGSSASFYGRITKETTKQEGGVP